MVWLILAIVLALGCFGLLGLREEAVEVEDRFGRKETEYQIKWRLRVIQLLSVFPLCLIFIGMVTKVPANSVGIKYSPFNGTSNVTLGEGFHGKNLFDKVYKISTEVQTSTMNGITTQTKDAQYVTSTLDIKYRVNSANAHLVFTQFRTLDKMSEALIVPTTQRVLELITTNYNVMDVLGEKRADIYKELEVELAKEFEKYGVQFYAISITDMDAGEAIENAITAEAVAKKEVETAAQNLLKAETEAKQKSVMAQAEQDAAKIEAETKTIQAEAEKKANELLHTTLTEEILLQQWIEKWNGKVPEYYGGDGTDLIFNTGALK